MTLSASVIIGGLLSFTLAIFHCFFYRYFKWKDEFKNISVVNARIFMTFHIGIIAVFLFFAYLSVVYTEELTRGDGLAGIVVGFYALMWLFRLVWQLTYLKPLRKEKPLLHSILTVWFLLLFAAYVTPLVVKVIS